MVALILLLLSLFGLPFKSKSRLAAENAALRQQVIVLQRKVHGRIEFTDSDRLFFIQATSLVVFFRSASFVCAERSANSCSTAPYGGSSPRRFRSTEELDEDVAAAIEDPQDNPEVTIQNRQVSEILLDCLKELSPVHREVIDLVYYHESSIDEVAEITGIPPNTVKTRMFYPTQFRLPARH
jgi:RNA polymerase sigma factor (sigma-70 family)